MKRLTLSILVLLAAPAVAQECTECRACLTWGQIGLLASLGRVELDCSPQAGGGPVCGLPYEVLEGAAPEPASPLHALLLAKLDQAWPEQGALFLDPRRDFLGRAAIRVLTAHLELGGTGAEWRQAAAAEVLRDVGLRLAKARAVRVPTGTGERPIEVLPIGSDPVAAWVIRQLRRDPGFSQAELEPLEEPQGRLAIKPALDLDAQVGELEAAAAEMTEQEFEAVFRLPPQFAELLGLLRPGS